MLQRKRPIMRVSSNVAARQAAMKVVKAAARDGGVAGNDVMGV